MIQIGIFTFNDFQENTYILYDETKECLIIDPGCYGKDEQDELTDFIKSEGLKPVLLINTHAHIDHVLGNSFVKDTYKIPLWIHKIEEAGLKAVKAYSPNYGIRNYEEAIPDHFVEEGDFAKFGNSSLEVLFVPGDSPGHIALFHKEEKFCIAGDVLFYRSIGRTDLPGGDHNMLIQSIHSKLFPLGDDVTIFPGHGPHTVIEDEKKHNPFCSLKA